MTIGSDACRDHATTRETPAERLDKLLPPLLTMQRSSWEQGSASQALLEGYASGMLPSGLHYIYGLVHDSAVRQAADGRLSVLLNGNGTSDPGAVDPACIGESFYFLLDLCHTQPGSLDRVDEKRFEDSIDKMLSFILDSCPRAPVPQTSHSPEDLLLSHRVDSVQIWSDAVYMLPPFLASAAAHYAHHPDANHDSVDLLRRALQQVVLASEVLQASTGEWSHIYDLGKRQFQRKAFWGVGNGWVCGGIIRVFRILARLFVDLPALHPVKEAWTSDQSMISLRTKCYDILLATIEGTLRHIREEDHLFHDVLDDRASFVETNLSQQLSYTLYRLLALHLDDSSRDILSWPALPGDTVTLWQKRADNLWEAAVRKTDKWGFVRDVCGSPTFNKAGTAAEGQAWAILMEVAKVEYEVWRTVA